MVQWNAIYITSRKAIEPIIAAADKVTLAVDMD